MLWKAELWEKMIATIQKNGIKITALIFHICLCYRSETQCCKKSKTAYRATSVQNGLNFIIFVNLNRFNQ